MVKPWVRMGRVPSLTVKWRVQSIEPVQSGTTRGGGEKEAHALITETFAP